MASLSLRRCARLLDLLPFALLAVLALWDGAPPSMALPLPRPPIPGPPAAVPDREQARFAPCAMAGGAIA